MLKNIFLILFSFAILISCSNSDNFHISGTITNSENNMVYLDKLGINETTPFDSSAIDSKGNFELSGSVSYPTFFLLRLNNQKFITLLVDSLEEITFSADYLNFTRDYKVTGSTGSMQVQDLNNHLRSTNNKVDSLQSLITMSMDAKNYAELKKQWSQEIQTVYTNQQNYSMKFINDNPFSMASVLAIYQKFNNGNYIVQDIQTLKVAASALKSMFPKSLHAQSLYRDTEKLVNDIRRQQLSDFIDQYGATSPDIELPDTKGKDVLLSSLKGKVILVQFWSCADKNCRVLNEVLRENYRTYKNKGFEIYQVSIDTDKDAWLKAIKEDQLSWINVGDMKGSIDALHNFNIHSVPSNYLIDRSGAIVARDLKGPEIHRKLSEILN